MRKQNWQSLLSGYLESQADKPFKWGSNDCVLFAAKGANKILTVNLIPAMKSYGKYNQKEAAKIIANHKKSIAHIFDKHFVRRENNNLAMRGDIALVNLDGMEAAGLVDLSGRRVACKGPKGVSFVPVSQIIACWNIEEVKECLQS